MREVCPNTDVLLALDVLDAQTDQSLQSADILSGRWTHTQTALIALPMAGIDFAQGATPGMHFKSDKASRSKEQQE